MPATYAHWRFGAECIEMMPKDLQKLVHEHRDIYNLGVHGPDIFFYNLPDKQLVSFGYNMHNIPFIAFIEFSRRIYNSIKFNDKDEMFVYLLGFLSHYVLDTTCHSYIERKTEVSKISHARVESQWERHLMELDNRVPNFVDRTESLRPNRKIATTISHFFNFSPRRTYRALKAMYELVKFENCVSERKLNLLRKAMAKFGFMDKYDLLVEFKEDERCKDSNLRLDKLENKALKMYPKLLKNYIDVLTLKTKKIDDFFKHPLCQWDDYKKINVLPYKKELAYKVK